MGMLLSWRVPSVVLVNQTGCRQCPTSGHPVCTEARGKVEHRRTPPLKVCFRDSCFSCLLPLPFAHFITSVIVFASRSQPLLWLLPRAWLPGHLYCPIVDWSLILLASQMSYLDSTCWNCQHGILGLIPGEKRELHNTTQLNWESHSMQLMRYSGWLLTLHIMIQELNLCSSECPSYREMGSKFK